MAFDAETKALFEEQAKTFEAFKAENDKLQAQVKKLGEDAVTRDVVEKLNKALDDLGDKFKAADKNNAELEAKLNRINLTGGAGTDAEAKMAAEFAREVKSFDPDFKGDFTVDELRERKQAVSDYLRGRQSKSVTLQVGTDPSGGFLVNPDVSGRMVRKVYESSPMRQLCNVVQIGTDRLEGPIDNGEADAQWVGEKDTRSQTDAPQLGKWAIDVNELYAYPWATQKLLEDAVIDVEGWLAMKASSKFSRKENTAFANGDGDGKPRGLFNYPTAATSDKAGTRAWGTFEHIATGVQADWPASNKADKLLDVIYALKADYRNNARWFMCRSTVASVRKLKDGQGNYLWQPAATAGQPSTLMGYAVAEGEDVPAITASTDTLSIAFGDFAETYTIVDRIGVSLVRDNITKPGFVKFHFRKRTGGGAINFESMKLLKFATA